MNSSDMQFNNSQLAAYAKFLAGLSILLVAVNIWVYTIAFYAGLAMSFGIVAYVVIIIIYYNVKKKTALESLIGFATSFSTLSVYQMERFDFPYAILDKTGKILWFNPAFAAITAEIPKLKKQPVYEVVTALSPEMLPHHGTETSVDIDYNNRQYRVYIRLLADYGDVSSFSFPDVPVQDLAHLFAISMFDNTELAVYRKKYEEEMAVVALLYLDNYEESLEGVEEVERSIVTAVIDRKLSEYFSQMDAVIRKFERDKYIIFMKNGSFAKLKENHFQVLEDIKNLKTDLTAHMSNAPTISIGVGTNQGSYMGNFDAARTCIELALGRGGDQAAVKDGEGIQYFGGKSQAADKSSRVKSRVKAHALYEIMNNSGNIIVMGHRNIDADAFGAAIGIAACARTIGKRIRIIVDNNTSAMRPLLESFAEIPEYDSVFISPEQAMEEVNDYTMLMIVDTTNPRFTACDPLLEKSKNIVVLDHHRRGSQVIANPVLSYVEPYASSTCEMVAEIMQYFDVPVKLTNAEADAIYAGIILDTDSFLQKTGVRTFEAAGYLRRCGADATRVRKLFRENLSDYLAKGEAIKNVKLLRASYAISVCPAEGLENPSIVGAQTANELLNIVGVKASFVLTKVQDTVYISARAIDEVNVQLVMERMGGGGHLSIAGTQLKGVTIEEALERLSVTLEQMLDGGEI
ncbi:MAG: DHH family phosphoesterase [Eubacterium sp.]|nr:DHH family phosphoesterase [Eubacterium sp.]